MKAVILAGGRGMRLRPITEKIAKPMVEVGGKPLLQWVIENLKEAGFEELIIVVNYKKEQIIKYFGDGSQYGVKIHYINSGPYKGQAAVYPAKKFFKPGENFLLTCADKVPKPSQIKAIVETHLREKPDVTCGISRTPSWSLGYTGTEVYSYEFFEWLEKAEEHKGEELQNVEAMKLWGKHGCKIAEVELEKELWLTHVDTPEQLERLRREFSKKGKKIFK